MGHTPDQLYSMTLGEFLNGYKGFIDNQEYETQRGFEQARLILSGLVSKPPTFPWEKEPDDDRPYTREELDEIAGYHERVQKQAVRKQKLTDKGWVDVSS